MSCTHRNLAYGLNFPFYLSIGDESPKSPKRGKGQMYYLSKAREFVTRNAVNSGLSRERSLLPVN
ncbi:hypothetical protein [Lyngbya aestuarii]|uniref:hypothetical protein n=1 Tax=Lyngbya aestuarii TaxID=118322 RepID=UPI00403D7EFB